MIRVLLVDDHTLVRAGLERLLDQVDDIEVVGVASGCLDALPAYEVHRPDVVLLDVSMPDIDGVECLRRMRATREDGAIVMLTAHTDSTSVLGALEAGANGYLVKDADPADIVAGVRSAARGDVPLDPRAARTMLEDRRSPAAPASSVDLTDRELDVLRLVAQGRPNKQIARSLGISEKTVKAHLTKVFARIGVTDRTQAALWATEHGVGVGS